MTIDFSCVTAWSGKKTAAPRNAMKASMVFRIEKLPPKPLLKLSCHMVPVVAARY
jgi:hypothetical protein